MSQKDYLDVEYTSEKRPLTEYPSKLAQYICKEFELQKGDEILEVGSGRSELLKHFKNLGLCTYAIDSASSAEAYAKSMGAKFEKFEIGKSKEKSPFEGKKFDVIFSKSFIEHLVEPLEYFNWAYESLKPGGKFINLTPDWETNYKIFFDDITHVKPFSTVTLNQALEFTNFKNIKVFRFRQLPSTWNSRSIDLLATISAIFAHHRIKNKWLRWSRELMIGSIGTK
jgi:cyclopropane fatty-acyl-phospholipid synthase-like methyltransferase